jgi:hypothetical protein
MPATPNTHRPAVSNLRFETKNGWVVFELRPGTPDLTNKTLDEWEKEEHEEEHRRAFSPRR